MNTENAAVPIAGISHTAAIVAAYLSNPQHKVAFSEVPALVRSMHGAMAQAASGAEDVKAPLRPAVPVKKSITREFIICLEDGKKLKMLKRYLRAQYGLSPEEYRAKWGLPHDYPMVTPAYSAQRSEFAKKIGLGRNAVSHKGRRR